MDKIKEEEKNIRDENGLTDYNRLARLINTEKWVINDELVKNNFQVWDLEVLLKRIKRSKNKPEKNKIQVSLINSGLTDLKKEIESMSEEEKRIEGVNKILNIVEEILEFNRQKQGQY